MAAMFKAILLDFNGVVVDDEGYQETLYIQVLRDMGIPLTPEQYQEQFLGRDDYSIAREALRLTGEEPSQQRVVDLVKEKTSRYIATAGPVVQPVPGIGRFMDEVGRRVKLGIVTGAPRAEVEFILKTFDLEGRLDVFVPLESFDRGKPDPQGYLLGLAGINQALAQQSALPILPTETLVVEDSKSGFKAGMAAGMAVAAITTSHPPEAFPGAWAATPSMEDLLEKVLPRLP